MIQFDNLTRSFGSVRALKGISATIESGETVGLLGPNGAGKTTFMRILASYRMPDSGRASVCGYDVVNASMEVRRRVGYLPESVPLYEDLIPSAYLRYRGRLKGMTGSLLSDRVETVLSSCGLNEMEGRPASALSKGYRKRLGLADAILTKPDVLLLDEPTEGLDPNQVRDTRDLIRSLSETTTLLLSTHILPEVEQVCDRVLIMNGGRIVYDGDLDGEDGKEQSVMIYLEVCGEDFDEMFFKEMDDVMGVERVEDSDDWIGFRIRVREDIRARIFDRCGEAGMKLRELRLEKESLETIFARCTQ